MLLASVCLLAPRVGGALPAESGVCGDWFMAPAPPAAATALNGIALPDVCFNRTGPHHVFVIGDWGGIVAPPRDVPAPADKRGRLFPERRPFIVGVDDQAQLLVASQMRARAAVSRPDYVLNVGDNFYWGGVEAECSRRPAYSHAETHQWRKVFEDVYNGLGLDGKQWLGVLGNHDYGGWIFTNAWDQAIAYTWGGPHSTGRWLTPAQYYSAKVHYPDFSVDYYFVDSNHFAALPVDLDPHHNLCSKEHNRRDAKCGTTGPDSVHDCPAWFARLWREQVAWLEAALEASSADWQVVVTHFPPHWGQDDWVQLAQRHGIDLFVSGHQHFQSVWLPNATSNPVRPTAVVVSGGGGGITSEGVPDPQGHDDQYGFMDLSLSKREILIKSISHGGQVRHTVAVKPRPPDPSPKPLQI